jgi:NADH-quinone oxidoreductase subunit E
MSLELSKESKKRIEQALGRYPHKQAALLPILHIVQEELGYVPENAEADIAAIVEIPVVKVREVLSFYSLYLRKPVGKYHLQLCRTISCTLRGHREILKCVEQKLGIKDGETTADGKFTITTVECLASCETAPMMQLNETYHGNLTPEKIDEILASLNGKK